MRWVTEPERRTPVMDDVDILVCGGGVAGVAAGIAAARNEAKVLLIERYGFLGGLATGGLVITVPPLNNGINSEIRKRLEDARAYVDCQNVGDDPASQGMIAVDPDLDSRVVITSFGWWFPEDPSPLFGWNKSNINILTRSEPPHDPTIGAVDLRGVPCKIYKAL